MTAERGDPPRFRFGPLERRGLVAGWRGGQIACMAGALLFGVVLLRSMPSLQGVIFALLIVALGAFLATWPLSGRTAEEWAPEAVRYAMGVARDRGLSTRNPFASLRMLDVDMDPDGTGSVLGSVGVVADDLSQVFTVVMPARGAGFVLSGEDDKARRVGRWASVLSSLAREGSAVHRVQWLERSLPDSGSVVRRHLERHGVLGADTLPGRSYRELLEITAPVTNRHEVFIALSIRRRSAARLVRAAGGGELGVCTMLLREAASLRRRLSDAEILVGAPLSFDELVCSIRSSYVDAEKISPEKPGTDRPSRERPGTVWPWPMNSAAEWSRLRVDETWHGTYWVAEWPRTDVGADFLGPLLLTSDVRRSVSVVMEPVAPLSAARQVEQARTADIADAELRKRGGFLATARRRREEEVLAHRELELADGHAQYRFTGYVTVTAPGPEELEEACGRVEQAAGQAGLELRRCYGDQLRAFVCTLPLARGLA